MDGDLQWKVRQLHQAQLPTQIDAHSVHLTLKNHPTTAFFGIFDGHGGSRASQYVAERLVGLIEELDDVFNQDELIRICIELDQQLLDSFEKNEANVGTTCTIIFSLLLPSLLSTLKV
jgi:protein phosphatase 2C family protein 2/3